MVVTALLLAGTQAFAGLGGVPPHDRVKCFAPDARLEAGYLFNRFSNLGQKFIHIYDLDKEMTGVSLYLTAPELKEELVSRGFINKVPRHIDDVKFETRYGRVDLILGYEFNMPLLQERMTDLGPLVFEGRPRRQLLDVKFTQVTDNVVNIRFTQVSQGTMKCLRSVDGFDPSTRDGEAFCMQTLETAQARVIQELSRDLVFRNCDVERL